MNFKRFPILSMPWHHEKEIIDVPWSLVAPHEQQAKKNHGQDLNMLARRGGLSESELVAVLEDRIWKAMDWKAATERIKELLAVHDSTQLAREEMGITETTWTLNEYRPDGSRGIVALTTEQAQQIKDLLMGQPSILYSLVSELETLATKWHKEYSAWKADYPLEARDRLSCFHELKSILSSIPKIEDSLSMEKEVL